MLGVKVFELLLDGARALKELERALGAGLSVHKAEMAPALNGLRRDPGYAQVLRRLRINPAADPGGLAPGVPGCPMSPRAGVGSNRS